MAEEATPGVGHNNPPADVDPVATVLAPYADEISEAEGWLDGEPVSNDGQLADADKLLKAIKGADKAVKEAEEAAAKPLHQAWKDEKARWAPTLKDLERIKKGLASIMEDYKKKKREEVERKRREAEAEAERKRQEAEAARRAAEDAGAGDIEAQRRAEAAQAEAQQAAKERAAANKEKVTGLRKVKCQSVDDYRAALNWIAANDPAPLKAWIDDYARTHPDAAISGVKRWVEEKAY